MLQKLMGAAGGVALLIFLVAARPVSAGVHQVWDEAHFLKLPTIDQVDQVLNDIHDRFGKDLMIETFASIPDDLKPNLQKDGKEKFYEGWTVSEGRELGVNGVVILVNGDPGHIQMEVGLETRKKAFTLNDRNELLAQLATAFHQKDFDGGILNAAKFVQDRMARNLGAGPGATTRPTTQPTSPPAAQTREAGTEAEKEKAPNLP